MSGSQEGVSPISGTVKIWRPPRRSRETLVELAVVSSTPTEPEPLIRLDRPICSELGSRDRLYTVEGADHSFHVLKRSGRSDEDVLAEIARETGEWFEKSSSVASS